MRVRFHRLWLVPLVAIAALSLSHTTAAVASARERIVTIRDNDAPSLQTEFDPDQGRWRFVETPRLVRQGDKVVFESKSSNHYPHTVTNLARTSSPTTLPVSFLAGALFDSGLIQPGDSYTLNTTPLPVGHYAYICRLHIWMVGELTIQEPD